MDLVDFISAERLKTYEAHSVNQRRAIALHNHTLHVGSSLMSMIAILELGLRNASSLQLSRAFDDRDWLCPDHNSVPLRPSEIALVTRAQSHARDEIYKKLKPRDKKKLDRSAFPKDTKLSKEQETIIVRERKQQLPLSHGQVMSQTTFAFWKRLYSAKYEDLLWRRSLKRVFPDKSIDRGKIAKSLEIVYMTRNRVAHHEPMYAARLTEAVDALRFLRSTMGATGRGKETPFKTLSKVPHLRLKMDYVAFTEAWDTLGKRST